MFRLSDAFAGWYPSAAAGFTAVVLAASAPLAPLAPPFRPMPDLPKPDLPKPDLLKPDLKTALAVPQGGGLRQMIPADVVRVIDGDTVEMRAAVWLDLHMTTRVRLKDIDAPEMKARCPAEARLAEAATAGLERLLAGQRLFLTDLARDKYGGRVVARIVTQGGADIGADLLRQGLARPYAGSRQRGWCG
jgi:micrococcal nuclease